MEILEHPAIARAQTTGYPEKTKTVYCSKCGGEIYTGEEYGVYYDKIICADCLEDEWRHLSATEKFLFLGYEVRVVE